MIIPDVVREKALQMEITILEEYINRVFRLLEAMKPGDVIHIAKASKEETRELFLEVIKLYMRQHNDDYQDGLSFANGYSELRKYDLVFIIKQKAKV